jgi:hypothetical protein
MDEHLRSSLSQDGEARCYEETFSPADLLTGGGGTNFFHFKGHNRCTGYTI